MKFQKGQRVIRITSVMGIETQELAEVLVVDEKGIWLDNGPGNRPDGPYDSRTGQWADNDVILGSRSTIVPIPPS